MILSISSLALFFSINADPNSFTSNWTKFIKTFVHALKLNLKNSPTKLFKLKTYLIIAPMLGGIQIQNVEKNIAGCRSQCLPRVKGEEEWR